MKGSQARGSTAVLSLSVSLCDAQAIHTELRAFVVFLRRF